MTWHILHLGDVHIRAGEHADDVKTCLSFLTGIVEARQPDLILIPGDIFETKSSPAEREILREWLLSLDSVFGGPIVIAKGNHDAAQDLLVWKMARNVHVFERAERVVFGKGSIDDRATRIYRDEIQLLSNHNPPSGGFFSA